MNLLTSPVRSGRALPLIAPSILSADFADMGRDCADAIAAGGDLLHLDVMDGHFVPNLTMGPDLCRCVRAALPNAFLDVHLMVTDPEKFIDPFAAAGADHLTFHVEVIPDDRIGEVVEKIRAKGLTAGLAINPPTPVERVVPHVTKVDMVLVMSVNPGYSGQSFIGSVLEKVRLIKPRLTGMQRLEMDGGIKPDNAPEVREAGCDTIVAASAIFGQPREQWKSVIRALRG